MKQSTIAQKITTRAKLARRVAAWRAAGKIVGFTSGSFDIIHAGHVAYLEKAKEKCDVLIAAINTDASVKLYKGEDRPIIPEEYRVKMMAALESIDYVFTFDERRNRKNLEIIKPSLYIKAGDYTLAELTSSDVVTKYGGEILILPLAEGFSTTNLIDKIVAVFGSQQAANRAVTTQEATVKASTESREPTKAVLIDRDGTINEEVEFLHEPEKFKLTANAGEGLKKLQGLGYKIVVITTQGGIGLGYFTKEDFFKVNGEMFKQLKPYDIVIDKIYFATKAKTEVGGNPKEALIERAREELDLDLAQCVVIGDKTGDLAAGEPYGCTKIGVSTGHALSDGNYQVKPDFVATDLLAAAEWLDENAGEATKKHRAAEAVAADSR